MQLVLVIKKLLYLWCNEYRKLQYPLCADFYEIYLYNIDYEGTFESISEKLDPEPHTIE